MHKDDIDYKVLRLSLILALVGLAIFLVLIPVGYSLSIGWLAGSFSAIMGYSIGILLINKSFEKKKSKSLGFWVGWLRFYINLFFQGVLFIAVVFINKSVNGHTFTGGNTSDMISPINVFTYIGGVSLILISTLVAQFLSRKEGINGRH